jgi:AcrR family transcriptional regulator
MKPAPPAPARPRAPRTPAATRRRELALAAAHEFHRRGFHQVTLGGVAAAVGLSAPAVYRHFANKHALLAAAVETGIEEIEAALAAADHDGGTIEAVLQRLTAAALRRPDFWTLSQREARYLDEAERTRSRDRFRIVADALRAHAPDDGEHDVAVTATLAVLSTPSFHASTLHEERVTNLLRAAAYLALVTTGSDVVDVGPAATPSESDPPDRAGQILETAFALFHRRGYAAVSLDDIGAAVGIAGPSIYHHYGSKTDLLLAAFHRVIAGLPVIDDGTTPEHAVRAYVDLALREREAMATRATEIISLPATDAELVERTLAADLAAWTTMLRRHRPDITEAEAALLVDAARSAVHDVVRLGPLHRRPGVREQLIAIGTAVLHTPTPTARA